LQCLLTTDGVALDMLLQECLFHPDVENVSWEFSTHVVYREFTCVT